VAFKYMRFLYHEYRYWLNRRSKRTHRQHGETRG